eukprot:1974406-Pyramimonas_sp.AAC.1
MAVRTRALGIWTPEAGAETMGTMPNNKRCPKPTAAAVGQAAFCLKWTQTRRRGRRILFRMGRN